MNIANRYRKSSLGCWIVLAVVGWCLLFSAMGSGVVWGMKGGEKKVSKVVKRFLLAEDRDQLFRDEFDNGERGKVLKFVSGREGARLLNLVEEGKDLEALWRNSMSRSTRERVWPHVDEHVRLVFGGDREEAQGFVSTTEKKWLTKVDSEFVGRLPLFMPAETNRKTVFQNLVRFLDGGEICRFMLVCDYVWPRSRGWVAGNSKLGLQRLVGKERAHWVRWTESSLEERPGLFANFSDGEAREIWLAASDYAKDWLWGKLPLEQRLRALGLQGGVLAKVAADGYGQEVKQAALQVGKFSGVLDAIWGELGRGQRGEFVKEHPVRSVRSFFQNLAAGSYGKTLPPEVLDGVKTLSLKVDPGKDDLAAVVWPKLSTRARPEWLKNVQNYQSSGLFGFYHDIAEENIGGDHAGQVYMNAFGATHPGNVLEKIWEHLTSEEKTRVSKEWPYMPEQQQKFIQDRFTIKGLVELLGHKAVLKHLPSNTIITVAGDGTEGFGGDNGLATSAQLHRPVGVFVSVSLDGDVFIADLGNHRVRRVSPQGVISTVAGDGTEGFGGDNGLATSAQLYHPSGVFVSLDGHIYIAEYGNHRVRRVSPQGVITTIAGNGTEGFGGDNGLATSAQLNGPSGVFLSLDGHLYIADHGNHRVRRVSPQGVITTIAGNGTKGFSGDNGLATSAQLNQPVGVFVSLDGHIYIAEYGNHRVRRVSPGGVITTVAGSGTEGFGGDNGLATSAQLNGPSGVFLSLDGHLYIADHGNHRVRRVSPEGVITTIAGNGTEGFSGDNGLATSAQLNSPVGVFLSLDGHIYIADRSNDRVRVVNLNQNQGEEKK